MQGKFFKSASVLALTLTLSACGIFKLGSSTTNDKFSPDKERIAILTSESNLAVDPSIAGLPVVLPAPYVNSRWAQPGGNTSNAVYHLSVSDALSPAWSTKVGEGNGDKGQRLAATPVAANGSVFVMDTKAEVTAVSISNGRKLWSTSLKNEDERSKVGYGGGVAHSDNTLYATTGYGTAFALDASSGSILWQYDGTIPFRNGPTVTENAIYGITIDNRLIAINRETGEEIWIQIGITENAGVYGGSVPAVDGDVVIAAFSSGELTAFRKENGLALWSDSLSRTSRLTPLATLADIDGHPVVDRGRVYAVSHAGSIVAIDLRTGQRAWEGNVASAKTPWLAGNFGFVVTVDAEIAAFSLIDGRVRWATRLQKFEKQNKRKGLISWTSPVLAGDRLFVASSHGYLATISPYSGEVISALELDAPVTVDPIVVNNSLLILDEDGVLTAFR